MGIDMGIKKVFFSVVHHPQNAALKPSKNIRQTNFRMNVKIIDIINNKDE